MIPRVTKVEFGDFFRTATPAILIDGLEDWPARCRWTPSFLASTLKRKPVVVAVSNDGHFDYTLSEDGSRSDNAYTNEEMPFEDAAAQIVGGDPARFVYLMQESIPAKFPELVTDIRKPEWIARAPTSNNLWFGRGSVTPLHHDTSHNFFAQVYGEKEFVLFAPDDMKNLYPFPLGVTMTHTSQVDLDAPDLVSFPRLAMATAHRFTLKSGEMLFMPAFWWHHVRSRGVSISVNYWWSADPQHVVACSNSLRELFARYAEDRLASLRRGVLARMGLTLATVGAMLLRARHRWGAALLAVAAFDHLINSVREQVGAPNDAGCPVPALAGDIQRSCALLAGWGLLSDAHLRIAEHISSMAHELRLGNEVDVPVAATAWLVQAVQAMPVVDVDGDVRDAAGGTPVLTGAVVQ